MLGIQLDGRVLAYHEDPLEESPIPSNKQKMVTIRNSLFFFNKHEAIHLAHNRKTKPFLTANLANI